MSASLEFYHCNDYVAITIDIEDCPVVELPLTELFDIANATVVDNYLDVVQDYVTQLLEDTTWLAKQSALCILCSRLCIYHRRNEDELLTLRQPALQRFISQMLRCRNGVHCDPIEVPIFIRFKHPEITLPRRTRFPTAISRVSRSTALICSAEAHDFDIARRMSTLDVLCSSTTSVSTLTEITADGSAACITAYWHSTEEGSLDSGAATSEQVPFVTIEDIGNSEYKDTTVPSTCSYFVECQNSLVIISVTSTLADIPHTALSLSCPGFVVCQKKVVVTSATSRMIYMGILPRHVTALVPCWADVSYLEAIEDSNRLLPSISMRFHPIDRGRLRTCTG